MLSSTTTTTTLPPTPLSKLNLPCRSLLLLTTTTTVSFPSLSIASPPPKQPDTTITDRIFMDFSICPSFFQTRTLGSDLAQCPDSEPVGRIVLGLYGNLVPTVSNYKSMCTGISGYYKGTMIQKIFPGQFFMAGRQGRRDKGEVKSPVNLLRNTESVDPKGFQLGHTKGGVLSLCLSENDDDDDDDIKLDLNYHNVEFMITTGPGPCPDLDGRNIVFGSVLEGKFDSSRIIYLKHNDKVHMIDLLYMGMSLTFIVIASLCHADFCSLYVLLCPRYCIFPLLYVNSWIYTVPVKLTDF